MRKASHIAARRDLARLESRSNGANPIPTPYLDASLIIKRLRHLLQTYRRGTVKGTADVLQAYCKGIADDRKTCAAVPQTYCKRSADVL